MDEELHYDEIQRAKALNAKATLEDTNILNMLDADEQISIINNITSQTVHVKAYEHVEDQVRTESFTEYVESTDIDEIALANLVTFDNAHLVAKHLASVDTTTATALLEELLYWHKQGRI